MIAWQSAANEKKEYTGGAETAEERMKRKSRKDFYIKIMYIYAISEEIIATDYANTSDNKC